MKASHCASGQTGHSAQVDVPAEHVSDGRATPGCGEEAKSSPGRLGRILISREKPADAHAAVRYRNHWFWIDDRDLQTKRAFAFMMMFFTLSETGDKENLPLITIPAQ